MILEQFAQLLRTCEGMENIRCTPKTVGSVGLFPGAPKILVQGPVFVHGTPLVFEVEIDAEDIDEVTPPLVFEFAQTIRRAVGKLEKQMKDGTATSLLDQGVMPSNFPDKMAF
jgi:hypothetical protein